MTPYRRVIVVAAQTGIPPWWIASELDRPVGSIKAILSQERARGEAIPRFTWTERSRVRRLGEAA